MVDDDAYVHVHTTNCTETESDLTIGSLKRKKINQDRKLETFLTPKVTTQPEGRAGAKDWKLETSRDGPWAAREGTWSGTSFLWDLDEDTLFLATLTVLSKVSPNPKCPSVPLSVPEPGTELGHLKYLSGLNQETTLLRSKQSLSQVDVLRKVPSP